MDSTSVRNQRHVTEDKLNEAITTVINGYNQFSLPMIWGLGKHASADGTKWDLHAQNLMSEYRLLLEYLSDVELRRLIQSATNKSERFNQFVQWVAFGGGALAAEGIRDEQRKFIKYNHLVANLLIFHNLVTMSKALERLAAEGHALHT